MNSIARLFSRRAAVAAGVVALAAGITAPAVLGSSHQKAQSRPGFTGKVQNLVLSDTANGNSASFAIELKAQADVSKAYTMKDQNARGWYVYKTLKAEAARTQAPLKAYLDSQGVNYRSFWVANVIFVHAGTRALVENLADRADVKQIEANDASYWLDTAPQLNPVAALAPEAQKSPSSVEWNVTMVHAPDLWSLGYTGQGIVVGNQDTGMRWTHNALKPHYRGWNGTAADHNYNWHDSIHSDIDGDGTNPCGFNSMQPCDDHGHGTHTTGTAVGVDSDNGGQPDRRRARREVDRLPQHGRGHRPARDVHGVLPVLHRSDRSQRPERRSDASARDVINNSWGCPASELCAPDTLQRSSRTRRPPGSSSRSPPATAARRARRSPTRPRSTTRASRPRRSPERYGARELQQPRARHGRRLQPAQAGHRRARASTSARRSTRATRPTRAELERHLDGRPARGRRRRAALVGDPVHGA